MTKQERKQKVEEVVPYIIENIIDFSREMSSTIISKMMKEGLLSKTGRWSADGLIRLGYASGMGMDKWFGNYSQDVILSVYDNCVTDKKYLNNMIIYWIRTSIPNYLPK
jgi:hypothetical protein